MSYIQAVVCCTEERKRKKKDQRKDTRETHENLTELKINLVELS